MEKYLFVYKSGNEIKNKFIITSELSQALVQNFCDVNLDDKGNKPIILNIIQLDDEVAKAL